MQSSYNRHVSTPQSFKMLVAHPSKSSDPSKGEEGNPVPIRQVFETQVITTHMGTGVLGLVNDTREVLLKIKVETTDYGNANTGNPPPFFPQDLIQIQGEGYLDLDRISSLKAGTHFGRGEGGGQGNVNDVAADLATVLNDVRSGIIAKVDPQNLNHVLVSSRGIVDKLFVKVFSLSYLLLNGQPPFVFEDNDGNVLYDPAADEEGSGVLLLRPKDILPMNQS